MSLREARAQVRAQAIEEAMQDQEQEERLERRLRKWTRATVWLGAAFVANVIAVVPFLAGHPLHDRWDSAGKRILQLSMGLFLAFIYVGGTASTFWYYLRGIKKIHKRFAPPGSKYRTTK